MSVDQTRPYPDGACWNEAWRQRRRADLLQEILEDRFLKCEDTDPESVKGKLIQWVDDFVEHADMSLNPLQCAVRFRDAIELCCREKWTGK